VSGAITRTLAIVRRELGSYFHSPVACAVLAVFLVVSGYFFYSWVGYYSLVSAQALQKQLPDPHLNVVEGIVRPFLSNVAVILLFFLPMLSMRLFAEELKTGTFELLFSYPVRDAEAVLGKFLAALLLLALLLTGVAACAVVTAAVATPEPGAFGAGLFGLLLIGSAFLALGIFASSLTANQIVAAVVTFGVLVVFLLLEWVGQFAGPRTAGVLGHLSLMQHFGDFAKGVVDAKDVVYYLGFAAFFLFASVRAVGWRRERGL